jgi:alkylated DNA repair dioxygenase AlkB
MHAPDFLAEPEEARLIEGIRGLDLTEATYKEYTARRRVSTLLAPFLLPLRTRVAQWSGIPSAEFNDALVAEYRPGTPLGWHRDMPDFEVVVGVSLASAATLRFRRYPPRKGGGIFTLQLEPRSAYMLQGESRWGWQHSIAPTPDLRYSITFRTRRAR